MSVIGPRPGLWNQDILTAERDKYNANDVKPGLTGWAQINGRDELEIPDKAKLDGEYVSKMGLMMDIKCFLGSVGVFAHDDSVVEGGTGELHNEKYPKKAKVHEDLDFTEEKMDDMYYDDTMKPVKCVDGYYGFRREYDQDGHVEGIIYLDSSGIRYHDWGLLKEDLLNCILLLPAGALLPVITNHKVKWYQALVFGVLISAVIETSQLVFMRGLFEWDDMIHNGLGCMVGCLVVDGGVKK